MRHTKVGGVILLILELYTCTDPCSPGSHVVLQDALRNVKSHSSPSQPSLCDTGLNTGWYRFKGYAGARMADSRNKPQPGDCSTSLPIYLKDSHPQLPDLSCNKGMEMETCVNLLNSNLCGAKHSDNVTVRKCCSGGFHFFIYHFNSQIGCYKAFCGTGNGDLTCRTDEMTHFARGTGTEKCIGIHPSMLKAPVLTGPFVDGGDFYFLCQIKVDRKMENLENAVFSVEFLFDGEVLVNTSVDIANTFRAMLSHKSLTGNLGKYISCRVKGRWREYPRGEMKHFIYSSNNYFAGVKVFKKGTDQEIWAIELPRDTLPFPFEIELVSYLPLTKNSYPFRDLTFRVRKDIRGFAVYSECHMTFTFHQAGEDLPIRSTPVMIYPVFGWPLKGDISPRYISLQLLRYLPFPFLGFGSNMWDGYEISDMPLRIKDPLSSECTLHGGHVTTLDGSNFDLWAPAEIMILKFTDQKTLFEVRSRLVRSSNAKTCSCAVAARENNDIFIVSACSMMNGNYDSAPILWYRPVQRDIAPMAYLDKDHTGDLYTIYFPSGAWVKVSRNSAKGLDIIIHTPSYFTANRGLRGVCGHFGGQLNDYRIVIRNTVKPSYSYFDATVSPVPAFNSGSARLYHYCHCQREGLVCEFNRNITHNSNVVNSIPIG